VLSVDITTFVTGLLSDHNDFAGLVLRPGVFGALELTSAQLTAAPTPEPASLTLLTVAALAAIARKRRMNY
jgi:hypothetical protein